MSRLNNWRSRLDPRDPDYEEAPELDQDDFEEPDDTGEVFDGPYHYVPPGERI